ncbi:MAG: flagellar basal body L-ring protein FlgH [Deltaproteobacteria bacterium]|nr:flagellar basal body L-ring protein FlgH [Deltaproteobacteria bacterium]
MTKKSCLPFLLGGMGIGLMLVSCAAPTKFSKEMPPHYVRDRENKMEPRTKGSLWRDSAGLFEDRKARGLNDLVTIKIIETSAASKKADTATSRESSIDFGIDSLLGIPLKYEWSGIFTPGSSGSLIPQVKGTAQNEFTGSGNTTREGSLVATITARVVDVLPNGNFIIESRKDITVNREKQILLLRGVIRPDDIASDNTILSNYIANAEMIYTGDGVINEKQGQGWMVRFWDWVWPF